MYAWETLCQVHTRVHTHARIQYTHAMNTAVMMAIYVCKLRRSTSHFSRDTKRPFPNGKWFTTLACHRLTRCKRCIGEVWIDYCHRVGDGSGVFLMESQYNGRTKRVWKIRWFVIAMKLVGGEVFTGMEWQVWRSW